MVEGRFAIDDEHVTGRAEGEELYAIAIDEAAGGRVQRVWFIK